VRRLVALTIVLALGAAAPGAARPSACGKRVACKGKPRVVGAGMPAAWAKRAPLPGAGRGGSAPDAPVPSEPRKPGAPAPPPPPPPPPPPDDPRYLQVVARDSVPDQWQLQLSRGALLSGTVEVEFNNRYAEDPHDLWLWRAGTTYRFDLVGNGEKATKHLALSAGTWKLWCDLPQHEERGMVAYVTVADG
jgi:hypothetical protein